MARRKAFLAALGGGAAFVLRAGDASSAASSKTASPRANATAAAMRRFDPKLTEGEIEKIARAIDDNGKAAAVLNPRAKPLANGDEPATVFTVASQ